MTHPHKDALDAFNAVDETLSFIRNMMNQPDEIVAMNILSFKADMDCMIKDLRKHGTTIRAALQHLTQIEQELDDAQRPEVETVSVRSRKEIVSRIKIELDLADHLNNEKKAEEIVAMLVGMYPVLRIVKMESDACLVCNKKHDGLSCPETIFKCGV